MASLGHADFISRVSTLEVDDVLQTIAIELNTVTNDYYDKNFIINVLSNTIGLYWLEPYLKSRVSLSQMFGGKEQKWFSQSSHIDSLSALYDKFVKNRARYIGDNGAYFNSYIKG